jgi:flagellar hook-associated protein 2
VLSSISTQTAYSSTTKKGGPLSGEGLARSIAGELLDDVVSAVGTGQTKLLSQLGIQTTRSGTLTFDSSKLATAVQQDPQGVASLLSGFAKGVEDYAKAATSSSGTVTSAARSAGQEASRRQDQIDAFEVRMAALETSYRARFAALDSVLGSLKHQQAAVTSAINGLPQYG